MSAWAVLKDAWVNRDKLGDANHTRELAAFMPAALEIQESPPHPLTRWLAMGLLVFIVFVITWSLLGHVDIVASAEGKIVPSTRVKQIQPLEKGTVKTLLVIEGQNVTKGQPLIELDTTFTQADKKRLQSELHTAKLKKVVSKGMLEILSKPANTVTADFISEYALSLPKDTIQVDAQLYKSLLNQQWLQYQSQLKGLESNLVRNKAEQSATQELITKFEQTLPIIQKRSATLKGLFSQNYISETDYLIAEQEHIEQKQDLAVQKQQLQQLYAVQTQINEEINLHKAQSSGALLTEVADLQRQIASLEEDYIKANDMDARQILYAPVSGRVQELAINTVGGVVTAAQQLMLIVPNEEHLAVEAFLENKDIGFVQKNMAAEIKIHTFPFTKYGVINAEITSVSGDATIDDTRGLIYRMQLRMDKSTIVVNGKQVNLMPGMAVTAEVKTGERRIIEFFLAPLLRAKSESIRER